MGLVFFADCNWLTIKRLRTTMQKAAFWLLICRLSGGKRRQIAASNAAFCRTGVLPLAYGCLSRRYKSNHFHS